MNILVIFNFSSEEVGTLSVDRNNINVEDVSLYEDDLENYY